MRIGIFTECYHPVLNGVVVSIDTFRKELEKRGHEFVIIATNVTGNIDQDKNVLRVPSILPGKPKGGRYPIAWPQNARKWAKILKPYNLDIIHSQHLLNLGLLGLNVANKLDVPAILTYHTLLTEYVHYVPIFGSLARKWIIKKSRDYGNRYDAIVTPSSSMKNLLVEYGISTPITSIPTGINMDDFNGGYTKKELQEKYQLPKNQPLIFLYVSRIGQEKNVYFLFKAMKEFIKYRQDAHLLMVGGGDELENAKKFVKQNDLTTFITFTGKQPKEETNKIFGGADVFVFASVTETQGIIIFEALASGLPVIAVNKMGPSDYIQDSVDGFLTPLNINQFVDKMKYLADRKDVRDKMSITARQNISEFSAQKCADKMEDLYERTIQYYRHRS